MNLNIDLNSLIENNLEKIIVDIIIGLFLSFIIWLIQRIVKLLIKKSKIDIEYVSYDFRGKGEGRSLHPTLVLTLTSKSSDDKKVLWNKIFYVRKILNKSKEDVFELKGIDKKNPLLLRKNIPLRIEGELVPSQLQFLKSIIIKDTVDKKSKMEKDSIIKIQKRASELLKILEEEEKKIHKY